MRDHTRDVRLRRPVVVAGAVALLVAGAGLAWLFLRVRTETAAPPAAAARPAAPSADRSPGVSSITVTLPQEVVARAGIATAPVAETSEAGDITVPAVVEPHGYKQVTVTPVAGGRVTRVVVELGQQVQRGQTMAEIYSPELADAQTAYLSAQAALDAARQRLKRTDRLVEIGAASRQELEEARAEVTKLATEVESARSALVLLGMSPAAVQRLSARQMTSTVSVPAPITGVVTTREANVGLNVTAGMPLFTVVDLSTVWIVGNVYERDLGKVRVGAPATVTTEAFAGLALTGRVNYVDPQVDEATRTAKVRVEVANRDRLLRLGMYVSLTFAGASSRTVVVVPAAAVQTIGDRSVVYVVDPRQQGRFIERRVTLGSRVNDRVQVPTGLSAGDVVVTQGSFFLRAERERTNPFGTAPASTASAPAASQSQTTPPAGVTVQVTERGFEPERGTVARGATVAVTFVRRTDATCAKEVVIESQNIRRELPLNEPATIDIKAASSGEIAFACGMNMFKGVVVVQ